MNRFWQPVDKKRFEERKCETEDEICIYFHPPDNVGLCSSEEQMACGCCREMRKKRRI